MPIRYDAVAYFSPPVNGRSRSHSREPRVDGLYAETPEAAARMWLWRLSEVERAATARVVIFAPMARPVGEHYEGEPVTFIRVDKKLIEAKP